MHSQAKTLLIRTVLLLVYGFAGAGIFTLIEKQDESNKAISNRMLQQLKKNFTKQRNMSDEEFELFAMATYNAVRIGLSVDWTYFRAVDFIYSAITTIGKCWVFFLWVLSCFLILGLSSVFEIERNGTRSLLRQFYMYSRQAWVQAPVFRSLIKKISLKKVYFLWSTVKKGPRENGLGFLLVQWPRADFFNSIRVYLSWFSRSESSLMQFDLNSL